MTIRYGSVCSGIEAATVAWHPLGWQPVWFSEIEDFPSEVLAHYYPHVPNLGDINGAGQAVIRSAARRLTPLECERLQGFPDNYTNIPGASDSARYSACGNSMAVPVMRWIGSRIDAVDKLCQLKNETGGDI